jgi:hypothetical protein
MSIDGIMDHESMRSGRLLNSAFFAHHTVEFLHFAGMGRGLIDRSPS